MENNHKSQFDAPRQSSFHHKHPKNTGAWQSRFEAHLKHSVLQRCYFIFFSSWMRIIFLTFPLIFFSSLGILTFIKVNQVYQYWKIDHESKLQKSLYYYRSILRKVFPEAYHYYPIKYDLNHLKMADIGLITAVYDVHGKEIGRFARQERSLVGLKDISPHFIRSLLIVEDKRFYEHNGVDYVAIVRAFLRNLMSWRIKEGGSTLTQQLCKLIFTDRARTFDRKIYELFMAWKIESFFDKNSILLMYVNYIHFGHNIDGIEEAAQFYFNKSARSLNLEESALLVSLVSNPNYYSPFNNLEASKKRHWLILNLLAKYGYVPFNEIEDRFIQFWSQHQFKHHYASKKKSIQTNQSTYVMEEVKRRVIKELSSQFDGDTQRAKNILYTHGWKIYTTIDLELQLKAEQIVKKHLNRYRDFIEQNTSNQDLDLNQIQGALIAIEPSSGHIKSFVGGDGFRKDNQYNRAFQAVRQPGSAFKPIFYLSILDEQIVSPYTLRKDAYQPIPLKNGELWEVHNYKDRYQNKYITLTDAIKISSNQVTAQLANQIGIRRMREIVRDVLGWSDEKAMQMYPDEQYSSVLGSVAMTPFELVQIYAAIANRGVNRQAKLILQIQDMSGQEIELFESRDLMSREVASKEATFQLTKMMQEVFEPGGTAWFLKKNGMLEFDVAGKTGTSQDSRDLWFVGFAPELATVSWIGHDANEPLYGVGGTIVGPMFSEFMDFASTRILFSHFMFDESYQFHVQRICKDSGLIAIEGRCSRIDYSALFIRNSNTEPWDYCNLEHRSLEQKSEEQKEDHGWMQHDREETDAKRVEERDELNVKFTPKKDALAPLLPLLERLLIEP